MLMGSVTFPWSSRRFNAQYRKMKNEKYRKACSCDLIYMKYLYHYSKHSHAWQHHFETTLNNECATYAQKKQKNLKNPSLLSYNKTLFNHYQNGAWIFSADEMGWLKVFFCFFFWSLTFSLPSVAGFSNHFRNEAECHLYVSPSVRQWKEGRSMFQTLRYPSACLNYTLAQTWGEWAAFRRDSFWSQNWDQNHSNCQSHYKTL